MHHAGKAASAAIASLRARETVSNASHRKAPWIFAVALAALPAIASGAPRAKTETARIALWANSTTSATAIEWSGSQNEATHRVHSNAGLTLSGSQNIFRAAVEYVTRYEQGGANNQFASAPVQVSAQSLPYAIDINAYRPGGAVQAALGAAYFDKTSACGSNGKWELSQRSFPLPPGVYWVPCDIEISGSNISARFTIATTGKIQLSGAQAKLTPFYRTLSLLTSSNAIDAVKLSGSRGEVTGLVWAPAGRVEVSGADWTLGCGVIGDTIKLAGSKTKVGNGACGAPPVAVDQEVATDEDVPVAVVLSITDPDQDIVRYEVVTPPQRGTLTGQAPSFSYVPNANVHGSDTFSVRAFDQFGQSATGNVRVTVRSVNDPPRLEPASFTTAEDTSLQIVLAATDVDGDTLTYNVVDLPTRGMLQGSGATRTYAPNPNLHGTDGFRVTASDGTVAVGPIVHTIVVTPVNDTPAATPQNRAAVEDTPLAIQLAGSDVDGDALTYTVVEQPAHGLVTGTPPNVTYIPNPNFFGTDRFGFVSSDATTASPVAHVTIAIAPVNDAPIAAAATVALDEDTSKPITLRATDPEGDAITFELGAPPSHGTVLGTAPSVSYTPQTNYHGPDQFGFVARDASGASSSAEIRLAVAPINDTPIAIAQVVQTDQDVPKPITLAGTDVDGDALTFDIVTQPQHGILAGTGALREYRPAAGFAGTASFTFSARDALSVSAAATVTIEVRATTPTPTCGTDRDADDDGLLDEACVTAFVPPNPVLVAPPLDPTVPANFADGSTFLYSGANPIQRGLEPGAIQSYRVIIMRGLVTDESGAPLSGVLVRVLDHPELGYTFTRSDGMFDLAANGGGELTVHYTKPGYLRSQRTTPTPWNDWQWVEDAALVKLDTSVTPVQFGPGAATQVARGSQITDPAGSRRATLIVPAGTSAALKFANGATRPMAALSVRATEYTVGPNGPERMPGALPPSSAYTYAVELSADEAIAAGAQAVEFSAPVAIYLENFLDFPLGVEIPIGSYDFREAQWLPENDGRVLQLLSVVDGVAQLDLEGQGVAASASDYAALGITTEERRQVASLYGAGAKLWRFAVSHFTPWDCNQARIPDPDDTPPDEPDPEDEDDPDPENSDDPPPPDGNPCDVGDTECENGDEDPSEPDDQAPDEEDEEVECGSIIGCETRSLSEVVEIPGTQMALRYNSLKTPARRLSPTGAQVRVRITNASPSPRLRNARLQVFALGHRIEVNFPAPVAPNRIHSLVIPFRDAYDRIWAGTQPLRVKLGYDYPISYASTTADFDRAWARYPDYRQFRWESTRPNGTYEVAREWYSKTRVVGLLGSTLPGFWDARGQGFGGWTLSGHHVFDPASRRLYLGDGSVRRIGAVSGAEVRQSSLLLKAHSPAQIEYLQRLATAPDGSIFVIANDADPNFAGGDGIWRFTTDGQRELWASLCSPEWAIECIAEDGYSQVYDVAKDIAVDARGRPWITDGRKIYRLNSPNDFTMMFDGSAGALTCSPERLAWRGGRLFFSCTSEGWVGTLWPDGQVSKLVGGGTETGDETLPERLHLVAPRDVAADDLGNLYVLDDGTNTVWRVQTNGRVARYLSSGSFQFSPDGTQAREAAFAGIADLAVNADGSLLFKDIGADRLRRVAPNGRVYTIAGGGASEVTTLTPSGGIVTRQMRFDAADFDVLPEGTIVHGHSVDGPSFVAAITNSSFGTYVGYRETPGQQIIVPSTSGREYYVFSSKGRHLETRRSDTNGVVRRFLYDNAGYIETIEDGDGNRTTVERDSTHRPMAIVSADGVRTSFGLDGNGFLGSIQTSDSQHWSMTYRADGLMHSFRDPQANESQFRWTDDARLERDTDAEGNHKTLVRTRWLSRKIERVELTSMEGKRNTFYVNRSPASNYERHALRADGSQRSQSITSSFTRTRTSPSGRVTQKLVGDPRFGIEAAYPASTVAQLGSAVARVTRERNVIPLVENATFGQLSLNERTTINGRPYVSAYDAAARRWTRTSPEGRSVTKTIDAQGRPLRVAVPGLADREYHYDARGRLEEISVGTGEERRTMRLGYDARGYLNLVQNAELQEIAFTNDSVGRRTRQTFADGRSLSFGYDAVGNLARIVLPNQSEHRFEYNRVNDVASYVAPAVAGLSRTDTRYAYNRDRQLLRLERPDGTALDVAYHHVLNQPARLTGQFGSVDLDVTEQGFRGAHGTGFASTRVVRAGQMIQQQEFELGSEDATVSARYEYDDNLWLRKLVLSARDPITGRPGTPALTELAYGYDRDGLLVSAAHDGVLQVLVRDARNGLLESGEVGAISDTWAYNTFGELSSYTARFGGNPVYSVHYDRDRLGRIRRREENIDGTVTSTLYSYDRSGRLDAVTQDGVVTEDYDYDLNSNRRTATYREGSNTTTVAGAFDAQDRLRSYGDFSYVYGAFGDLRERLRVSATTPSRFDYDELGRL